MPSEPPVAVPVDVTVKSVAVFPLEAEIPAPYIPPVVSTAVTAVVPVPLFAALIPETPPMAVPVEVIVRSVETFSL